MASSKKKTRGGELQRGLQRLRELGIPVDELSPTTIDQLKPLVGRDREIDLGVAHVLGRIADSAAVEVLTGLEQATADKEVKREIRRSLYRLGQRGIVPSQPRAEDTPRRVLLGLGPISEGYISSVDGAGGRLVWLVRPQPGSGLLLLQGMVSDREGLVRLGGLTIRRRELRNMAREIQQKHGVTMISVPWEYCDLLLYEGYEKAKGLSKPGLEDYLSLRSSFNPSKPKITRHPVYDRFGGEDPRSGAWRELSRRLLDEPDFRLWILDEDWMKPYLEQVQRARDSRLVLNEIQQEERFAGIVRDAVKEIFTDERGRIFRRRMEDMALYLLETRREELAKLALAVALQLAEGEIGWLDISFLTGLAQKSLAFYLSQEKEKAAEEPSLIVKP
ncbi:MAG: hypothetical protein HY695_36905 [Deltaproteobacteria bacterium]|nr:hypothetical protein [Deltaproteobacteria bacterium]